MFSRYLNNYCGGITLDDGEDEFYVITSTLVIKSYIPLWSVVINVNVVVLEYVAHSETNQTRPFGYLLVSIYAYDILLFFSYNKKTTS